ncbi:hypothetical protein BOTCAL_0074g00340 [Botryotinia calthae]|uniref:Uncharacterized protein n=1 Tax=Botryotinia calthae TaxID=38488 RepID=A0A4Y8DAX0_9HELO|nr:hypothetical protein BOTCAL_0074g00340 [Botryotinia calthae]
MNQTPESSPSPLNKDMMNLEIVDNPPATSSYAEMKVDTPVINVFAIQGFSEKARTVGGFLRTPPETPFPRSMELSTRQSAPGLSAQPFPRSDRNTCMLRSPLDVFVNVSATAPYVVFQRPGAYTYQFQNSSIRGQIVRKCRRCVAGCEFKTCSQSVCDECVENGHGSPTDVSIVRAQLMEELERYPFSRMGNPMNGNPATGKAAIDNDKETKASYDSDATIYIMGDY